jgi:hypothetical protein
MFIVALFTIAKLWKQPRCPTTDEWIKNVLRGYKMVDRIGNYNTELCDFRNHFETWELHLGYSDSF